MYSHFSCTQSSRPTSMTWPPLRPRTPTHAWESGTEVSTPIASSVRSRRVRHPLRALWPQLQSSCRDLPSALDLHAFRSDMLSMRDEVIEDMPWHHPQQRYRGNSKRKRHMCECGARFNSVESLQEHMYLAHPREKMEEASLLLFLGHKYRPVEEPLRKQIRASYK